MSSPSAGTPTLSDPKAGTVADAAGVDLLDYGLGFGDRIDKGQGDFVKGHPVELGEQAVAEHFRGDTGPIGYKKSSAFLLHCEVPRKDIL